MGQLNVGYYTTAVLSRSSASSAHVLPARPRRATHWWAFALAGLVGIANSIAFVLITQYYTSGTYRPVREIAEASKTGPATTIISGIAVGFENTALPVLAIAPRAGPARIISARWPASARTASSTSGGIYGTAVATMGMLMSAGYILAMDTFGPITDNAGGIVEMSGAPSRCATSPTRSTAWATPPRR